MLVVHRVAQLPDLLFNLGDFLGAKLDRGIRPVPTPLVLVQLEQADHQVEAGPVQIHVEPVSAQDVHERGCAQSQVLQKRPKKETLNYLLLLSNRPQPSQGRLPFFKHVERSSFQIIPVYLLIPSPPEQLLNH